MSINLIDKQPIEIYLEGFLPSNEQAASLLKHALTRVLSKRSNNMTEIRELPADAQDWARKQFSDGKIIHRVEPDAGLDDKVRHIADWIAAAVANQAEWICNASSQGKPIRFDKINTIERAIEEADKDMRLANRAMAEQMKSAPSGEGETTVMELDNGFRIVQLSTTGALDREGVAMGHCIGQGAYDEGLVNKTRQFFSLRDRNNEPHATIEVDVASHAVTQCQGKENKAPVQKYIPYLQAYLKKERYTLNAPANRTGLVEANGEYYDIYKLPKNLKLAGDLNLMDTDITQLPEGLHVGGHLHLQRTGITQLPKGLHVGRNLDLQHTSIMQLSEGLHVGGYLDLRGTSITQLPEGLHVGGDLYLNGTLITQLPEGLHVGGNLELRGTAITQLPKGLYVGRNLDLQRTGITQLPEDAVIGGQVIGLSSMAEKYARPDQSKRLSGANKNIGSTAIR